MYKYNIDKIYEEDNKSRCICGYSVGKYQRHIHNHLMCLIRNSNNTIDNMKQHGEMSFSGQDMTYFINELAQRKKDTRSEHMHVIRKECLKTIKKIEELLTQDNINIFKDFIKQYPKYNNMFNNNIDKITWEEVTTLGNGTVIGDIRLFLNSDFVKEKIAKIERERWVKEKEVIKLREEKRLKDEETKLKKEYECIKLYNQIESNKMNSYEIYKEYSKIKILHEQYPNKNYFLEYFTNTKITEIQKLLNN